MNVRTHQLKKAICKILELKVQPFFILIRGCCPLSSVPDRCHHVPVDSCAVHSRMNSESVWRNNGRMWQIITYNLSIIHTQGLFVVTQIAAVNLVMGKMTFAKVWGVSSVSKELFWFNSLLHQLSFESWKMEEHSHRIEVSFHTEGSGLVIMMCR